MQARLRHVGLVVQNLDRMIDFYRETFGFEIVRRTEESGPFLEGLQALSDVRLTTVKMMLPGDTVQIELLKFHVHGRTNMPAPVNANGFTHIALTLEDVTVAHENMSRQGLKFNAAPALAPDGKAKVVFGRDPEGNLLELVQML